MDELIDVLDDNGNATENVALKSQVHNKGFWHATIHVWFYTVNGKILIQRRAHNKDTFPSLWDVSVAGHVAASENIEEAAIREVKEEIGLQLNLSDLRKIGVFKAQHRHAEKFIDREFHHVYIAELNGGLDILKKQDSEVADLKLISMLQFAEETMGLARTKKYVPHGSPYYKSIIQEIKKVLPF